MYDIKALYEAESVDDACRLLKEHPGSQVIAGGSDVLVQVREGKRAGKELVSIYMLDELRGICLDADENIRIGSLTSFSHITKNPIIQKYINVLGEAVDQIGGPQIRNIGTIGGETSLFAWDAQVEIAGEGYRRVVPINEFYIKAGTVALKEGEIQTAIIIPKKAYEGYKGHYIKYAMREAMDIATTGCSVNVKLSADKKIFEDVRIAYGVAGPIPMRVFSAENFLRGKEVNDENMEAFSQKVLDDINPRDSWRASKAFRCHIGVVMAKRACEKAVKQAGGVVDDRTEI